MRRSGVGLALVISLAIDQIFCLAPSMSPDIEPVVSSTKQTSILGLPFCSEGSLLAIPFDATSNAQVSSVAIAWFPLTLTLGERGKPAEMAGISDVSPSGTDLLSPAAENMRTTEDGGARRARWTFLPLPVGEGRGEGNTTPA